MSADLRYALLLTLLVTPFFATAQDATAATTTSAAIATETAPPSTNQANDAATSNKIAVPQAGKGRIVFFRPSKLLGSGIGFRIREGKTELGKLRNGKYFVADVEPGTHQYTVHSEAKDVLTLEIEDGETYYVQGTITMGILTGHPNLAPSNQAVFDGIADKLKLDN